MVLKGEATPAEIMAYVAERVAPFKKLRALEVIDQIPKSAVGQDPAEGAGRSGARCEGLSRRRAESEEVG